MINIGCDIGKSNLDVYVEGKLRRYKNGKTGIENFVKLCLKNELNRVVLEPTGGYERVLLTKLHEQGITTAVAVLCEEFRKKLNQQNINFSVLPSQGYCVGNQPSILNFGTSYSKTPKMICTSFLTIA